MDKRSLPTVVAAVVLVAILVTYMITYQVSFTERVGVTTFGKPHERYDAVVEQIGSDPAAVTAVVQEAADVSTDDARQLLQALPATVAKNLEPAPARQVLELLRQAGAEARIRQTATTPGWALKWPWPIQQVIRYDGRVQMLEDTEEETLTKDGKNIIAVTYCGWRVDDALKFSRRIKKLKQAPESLIKLVRSAKTAVIANYKLDDFVSVDRDALRRQYDQIEGEIHQRVRRQALTEYGIEVEALGIKRISLPTAVSEKVFEQMRETRKKQADTTRAEGDAEAERIRARAESAKERILSFARNTAERIKSEGDAAAATYYKVFSENQEFAWFLEQIEFLKQTLKEDTTFLIDWQTPPFSYFQSDEQVLKDVLGATSRPAD